MISDTEPNKDAGASDAANPNKARRPIASPKMTTVPPIATILFGSSNPLSPSRLLTIIVVM